MFYFQLIRFLLPLILTVVVQELSRQFLNGGMARMPQATETLASYGVALGLVTLFVSPLMQTKQLGLVLVDSQQALKKLQLFVLVVSLILTGILLSLAFGPLSAWIIEDLHQVQPSLSITVREAIFWLSPFPILMGIKLFYSGLILRVHHTEIITYATMINIGASVATIFALLPIGFVQNKPILLPLLVTYTGGIAELIIILWGYRRYKRGLILGGSDRTLSFSYIIKFFWPLALIMGIQGISRPVINLFISRGSDSAEALAILTIVYSLGRLPYGWLNELRTLLPAFREQADKLRSIRRFSVSCGTLSFGTMLLLFWTPLRPVILETMLGLEPELAARCTMPLFIFTFFPVAVMVRAYFHGIGLLEHRTKAMAPSGPARLIGILAALALLSQFEMHGATRGIAALLSGFSFEAAAVWWGIRRKA